MGVSGSGKSTLGALLAGALDCPFLGGDAFHHAAAVAKMSAGHALGDADRLPWLDRIGVAVASTVGELGLAVAARSALRRCYRDLLTTAISDRTRFVLLDTDRGKLVRGLAIREGHYMPLGMLDSRLDTLERPAGGGDALALDARASPASHRAQALAWLR